RKNPSNVITPANASRVRIFGAARRSSVGRTGPSSSNLVRAAAERVAAGVLTTAGENAGAEPVRLALRIRGPPSGGTGSALAGTNFEQWGGCQCFLLRSFAPNMRPSNPSATHHFSP